MSTDQGWVGEHVSSDHTVLPDLGAAGKGSSAEDAPAKGRRKKDGKNASGQSTAETPDEGGSAGRTLLLAAAGVVALAVVGFFVWPFLGDLLESEPLPPEQVAFVSEEEIEPTQQFVIENGVLYLEGTVPNADVSIALVSAAGSALGDDRVVNNMTVSDDAVYDPTAPVQLTVAETVLFGSGRTDVARQYVPLVDLAVELLESEESVHITVVGHTDDIGDEDLNEQLSLERAQATARQFAVRGIERTRLTVEGRGESDPMAANDTEAGRRVNRRVEFLVTGLLG